MHDDFERVMCGPQSQGLYESNYLKANHPAGEGAFWIKYNQLSPKADPGRRFGELWAIYWSGPGARPIAVKSVVPGAQIEASPQRLGLQMESASLDPDRAVGKIESGGHELAWDLSLHEGGSPLFHFPHQALYTLGFPKKKMMTSRPEQVFRGHLEVDGAKIDIDNWVGLRGHNWGTEHAHSYAYGNANLWDQEGRWVFDAFTVRIRLGPVLSPWLSLGVLRLPSREIAFNQMRTWINPSTRVEFPTWWCELRRGGSSLKAHASCDPADVVGLRYLHPDGKVSYCYNTKFAKLSVELQHRDHREHRTSSFSELEFLTPDPLPEIPLHGDDRLPV